MKFFIIQINNLKNNPMKEFDEWNVTKKEINEESYRLLYQEREIWLAHVGVNVGIEQDGGWNNFIRPVLVFRKFNQKHFLAIPLTTKAKESSFGFDLGEITFLKKRSWLTLTQIKAMDSKRLDRRLGRLPKRIFKEIQKKSAQTFVRASGA